jgi:hypothetical protein
VFAPTFETSIFSNQYFFVLPTPSAPSGAGETFGGASTPPDPTTVPEPDLLPPWPQVAMSGSRKALPISIRINFTGSKTPADSLKFGNAGNECTENLGLVDCTNQTGYWVWNLEGNARVFDDASNWKVAVSNEYRYSGLYVDSNNSLHPFSCSMTTPDDGPRQTYLQQPPGQKSIFYIDGPGPFYGTNPDKPCLVGTGAVYSLNDVLNFRVQFTNTVTHFTRSVYYYVKIVVAPGGRLDATHSAAGYGNLSLNF